MRTTLASHRRTQTLALCLALTALTALTTATLAQLSGNTPGTLVASSTGDMVLTGATEPAFKVDVPSVLRGLLANVAVKEGQPVKKGDILGKLDDALQVQQVELARLEAEQMAEIHGAENQVKFAENELKMVTDARASAEEVLQKTLACQQSKLSLELQTERKQQSQVKFKQEQITLERMTIRSPIDGFVLRVHKQAGEQTDDGPVFTVVQTSRLNAVFFLPKQLFGKVLVGSRAQLEMEGTKREGVVVAVDPSIDAGLFRVKLEVENTDARVPAGINARWIWPKI